MLGFTYTNDGTAWDSRNARRANLRVRRIVSPLAERDRLVRMPGRSE
jgi:hypothetical protein